MGTEDLIQEGRLRAVIIAIYAIFFVGLFYLATIIQQWGLLKIFIIILDCLFGYYFIRATIPVMRNYEIKDNYLSQMRTNLELQNIELIKKIGYIPNEEEFSNTLRRFIGKNAISSKERLEKLKKERKEFKEKWKKKE